MYKKYAETEGINHYKHIYKVGVNIYFKHSLLTSYALRFERTARVHTGHRQVLKHCVCLSILRVHCEHDNLPCGETARS